MKQEIFAYSFQGSSHIRKEENVENKGKKFPCQDRSFGGDFESTEVVEKKEVTLFVKNKSNQSSCVMLPVELKPHKTAFSLVCVSDGHGGFPYFKSQIGAEFAIQTTIELLSESIDKIAIALSEKDYTRINTNISNSFVRRWTRKIITDIARTNRNDLEKELAELKENDENAWKVYTGELDKAYALAEKYETLRQNSMGGEENKDLLFLLKDFIKLDIKSMYGCTIATYFKIKDTPLWYAFKVGDSDILASFNGEYIKPIADDPKCYENVTTSLCNTDAVRNFCFPDEKYLREIPETVFCSSDGVANSFTDEVFLKKVYSQLQISCDEDGIYKTENEIKEKLPILSNQGSGDDVSLAGIISYDDSLQAKKQRRATVCAKAAQYYEAGNYALIEPLFKPYLDRNEGDFRRILAFYDYKEVKRLAGFKMSPDFLTQWDKAYTNLNSIMSDYSQRQYYSMVEHSIKQLNKIMQDIIKKDISNNSSVITSVSIDELFSPFVYDEPNIFSYYKIYYEYTWICNCYKNGFYSTFNDIFFKVEKDLAFLEKVDNVNFVGNMKKELRKMLSNIYLLKARYWEKTCMLVKGS